MAKIKKTKSKKAREYKQYLIPAIVGGGVAWIYSGGAFDFGFVIFVAVWIGSWFGYRTVAKR